VQLTSPSKLREAAGQYLAECLGISMCLGSAGGIFCIHLVFLKNKITLEQIQIQNSHYVPTLIVQWCWNKLPFSKHLGYGGPSGNS
jgi:hypothetical protein